MSINFYDRKTATTIKIDVFAFTYLQDIYHIIYNQLSLSNSVKLTIFSTLQVDKTFKQIQYNDYSRLDEMLKLQEPTPENPRPLRHFEVYYKTTITKHGEQYTDMTPDNIIPGSRVISGYAREVCAQGEEVRIGDIENGAYITIPANSGISGKLRIQTIEVSDDAMSKYSGINNFSSRNVTKGVGYNPNANKNANK
jgi:hypothetical protein